jgi:RNA polymerase sigma factor (sigma-70 family)
MSYNTLADEELMLKVQQGDSPAFAAVYDRYANLLFRYFYRMLWQDKEKARDFVQDLFTKIITNPGMYDAGRPFRTWLFSVAMNMCKNEYRKTEVRKVAAEEIRIRSAKNSHPDALVNRIESSDFGKALETAVGELENHHRETFILRYRQDLSMKEIGEVMGCSEGTVKSRLFYAVRKLSEKLKDYKGLVDTS